MFSELICFFYDITDASNLISSFSGFSKSSLNIWKFSVHKLLKSGLENFEQYFASMWNECNPVVVWLSLAFPLFEIQMKIDLFQSCGHCWVFQICWLLGASVRNSAHGKGHEEGGLAYAKAWSSLRKTPVPSIYPQNQSSYFTVSCSHLHLRLYGGLSPITISLREGVNMQLQVNKNSWTWQECFSLRTPLKVI